MLRSHDGTRTEVECDIVSHDLLSDCTLARSQCDIPVIVTLEAKGINAAAVLVKVSNFFCLSD